MYTMKFTRHIDVPSTIAWEIISDLEKYADYAPNLSHVKIISGDGVGLVRRCADTQGGEWNEECVIWDEGRVYSIQVDTSDYPYPFTAMQGTWGVEPAGTGTQVTMQFEFQPEKDPPIIGWLMVNVMMRPAFTKIGNKLMDNWETAMYDLQKKTMLAVA